MNFALAVNRLLNSGIHCSAKVAMRLDIVVGRLSWIIAMLHSQGVLAPIRGSHNVLYRFAPSSSHPSAQRHRTWSRWHMVLHHSQRGGLTKTPFYRHSVAIMLIRQSIH
jgi:hypothetical protein